MNIKYNKSYENGQKVTAQSSPFLALLAVLFIGLKLTHYITWSWWLVLLPLYGPLALVLAVVAIGVVIYMLALIIKSVFS